MAVQCEKRKDAQKICSRNLHTLLRQSLPGEKRIAFHVEEVTTVPTDESNEENFGSYAR